VGPDNGLLSCALPEDSRPPEPARVTIADGTAVELLNPAWRRENVSNTFHGRDVFAPAAARLARGEDLHTGGPRLESLWALPAFRARERDGAVSGRVIHIDIYGNLVTDILASQWTEGAEAVLVTTSGETALARYRTFAEAPHGAPFAYVASGGRVAVAVRDGSAAAWAGCDRRALAVRLRMPG
jgi:S-adenosylmethionine hydrolase